MQPSSNVTALFMALGLLAAGVGPARAAAPPRQRPREATPPQARRAAERGLAFLRKDAQKWRKERKCSTCHHGTMTVWALSEAKSQGYAVKPETLVDVRKWTWDRLLEERIDLPRDKRPG